MKMNNAELFRKRVKAPDLNVNSGVYAGINPKIAMHLSSSGEYTYDGIDYKDIDLMGKLLELSAFGGVGPTEDQIASELFGSADAIKSDPITGLYVANFVGWSCDPKIRNNASSGGLTSWLLGKMLELGLIDGVIHMHSNEAGDKLFEYKISRTKENVYVNAKTRYFPGELSEVLKEIRYSQERFALVAIPSIAYEIRLLQLADPTWNARIPFVIGLLCGHQKTANYAEYLGWRLGFKPGNLRSIDFRKKVSGKPAIEYMTECTGLIDGEIVNKSAMQTDIYGTNWGYGFFKPNFSDFSEDAFNETADVVFGDAWLEPYMSDDQGTNIAIVRNPFLHKLMRDGALSGEVHLEDISIEQVKASQGGLIRQYVDELPYRFEFLAKQGLYVPLVIRRPSPTRPGLSRRKLQQNRMKSSLYSHESYMKARLENNLQIFDKEMKKVTRRLDGFYKTCCLIGKLWQIPRVVIQTSREKIGSRVSTPGN